MLSILFSEKFISQFEKLSPKIQSLAEKKIEVFKANPKHKSLNTHKLHGMLSGLFSFSVNHQIRIVFEYEDNKSAHFLKIGSHEVYR